MIVRKLEANERLEAERISMIAFHGTMSAEEREQILREPWEPAELNYGAFTDDGRMMARIVNNKMTTRFDGHLIPTGGIGAVSTLPEYREYGCIRRIFEILLPDAYRDGEVLSYLYPFNISFYRKFGYEAVPYQRDYTLAPSVLKNYRFHGEAVLYPDGDVTAENFAALYSRFADDYNVAALRDAAYFQKQKLKGDYFRDRRFAYLLRENGEDVAYLIFQDVKNEIVVQDLAFLGKAGLEAILGFLARFTADYARIRLYMPIGVELCSVMQSRDMYDMTNETRQNLMVRVVNARETLRLLRKPAGTRFVIQINGDEQIAQNNQTYLVTNDDVVPTQEQPDLIVSIQSLGQLAIGVTDLFEAAFRADTQIVSNQQTLRAVFTHKPRMMQNYF